MTDDSPPQPPDPTKRQLDFLHARLDGLYTRIGAAEEVIALYVRPPDAAPASQPRGPQLVVSCEACHRLQAEVAELRRCFDAGGRGTLSATDEVFLAQLWPTVASEKGTECWTLSELRELPNVRLVLGDRSPSSIGQLFAKVASDKAINAAGRTIAGFELERVGRHGSRTMWKLWLRAG